MKWLRLIMTAVIVTLGVWCWIALHPSPERLIRKQLEGVARAASFGRNEGDLAKLASAARLAGFFSSNVQVVIDISGHQEHNFSGREEIQQAALAAHGMAGALAVSFPDATVIVSADKESAVADVTLQAQWTGEQDRIVQEMKIDFQKLNGQWLIVKVQPVRTLK